MTNLLIIGTSHTAALRLAWRAAPQPGLTLTFAALQGDMADFLVAGHSLTATDPAKLARFSGQPSFDLTAYDAIALCGGTPSTFHGQRLYALARWPALPSALAAPLDAPNLISAQCFELALSGLIRTAPAFALMDLIRMASPTPLFAIPHPALSALVLTQSKRHPAFVQIHRNGDGPALAAMLDRAAHRACGDLARYVAPPTPVRQHGFFTHPEYRRGATRIGPDDSVPQPPDDPLHGNAAYGQHVLTALLAAL